MIEILLSFTTQRKKHMEFSPERDNFDDDDGVISTFCHSFKDCKIKLSTIAPFCLLAASPKASRGFVPRGN